MKRNRKEVTIITVCPFCGHANEIEVNEIDYLDWSDGELLVQDAFPYLSADEREMLISGICPKCWDSMFGLPEEEEEDLYEEDPSVEEEMGWDEYDANHCFDSEVNDFDIEMGFDPYEGCYSYDC